MQRQISDPQLWYLSCSLALVRKTVINLGGSEETYLSQQVRKPNFSIRFQISTELSFSIIFFI